jgi:hypothetical protein
MAEATVVATAEATDRNSQHNTFYQPQRLILKQSKLAHFKILPSNVATAALTVATAASAALTVATITEATVVATTEAIVGVITVPMMQRGIPTEGEGFVQLTSSFR